MNYLNCTASIAALALGLTACSEPATETAPDAAAATAVEYAPPPSREDLTAGLHDAGTAIWNLELLHEVPTPAGFNDPEALWAPAVERALAIAAEAGEEVARPPSPISFANTDVAFSGNRIVLGNWHGFNVFEAEGDAEPQLVLSVVCPGGQGDVSIHGNLVFRSVEDRRARLDCTGVEIEGDASAERFRGVQIFDISDITAPRQIAAVQTCRGSHTHTLVPDPTDPNVLYIYNSATSSVRPTEELDICSDGEPDENPDTARYSIDIIRVALDAPEQAAIIERPRLFADAETGAIAGLWAGGVHEGQERETGSTNQCHDITAYPEAGLAAGACSGNGILIDIRDPANPVRISETSDPNMVYWHAAIFNNAASKIVFTDEWGGGLGARCQSEDPDRWGADIVADITEDGLVTRGFFKIPNGQTATENCVAHNGGLVPVPGRDIMLQGWYSGGISMIDFTDSDNPFEIAFFDRGPVDAEELYLAGNWAAYWYNGRIYAPEIVRGLDILRLVPSAYLSANEIAAAEAIHFDESNPQTQQRFVWPQEAVIAQAYLDQLVRAGRVAPELAAQIRSAIDTGQTTRMLTSNLAAATRAASGRDAERFQAISDWLHRAG
ncbi:hypothetical protein [uncultured Maricaulis sp.]|uniref:LVIVD repeat-containing protein n=1 Tax=uncultured Maricaulis sp. TaxID=174710 RepID=UPI0030DA933E|tara:strand:- start:198 stop:2030 length:1833 start_codon:yes stop_codon:yes gene_type:complete